MNQHTLLARTCFKPTFYPKKSLSFLLLFFGYCLLLNLGTTAFAQIVDDNTLPENSDPLTIDNITRISGGTTAGNNLFHSFEQFSLPAGNTAWFDNALIIENIIGRVTGDSVSHIDGLIRANGTANLFLINPNGIVFGENSALDIGGSFVGSTADSLKFADGNEFSAIDPQAPPLLQVNIPVGLQYGKNNGNIEVLGSGNQLQFNPDFTVDRSSRPTGLEVDQGKTLALVGGNILSDGGNLTADAGRIELGSVADHEFVPFGLTDSGLDFDYTEVSDFKNINLANASSLEVSGNGAGSVQVQGQEIIITDGSAILADTFGDSNGGKLQVNASQLLVVAGTSFDLPFISRLSTDVEPGATGNAGDIELNSANLIIADGAQVISSSYGNGDTGNIKVDADYVELFSGSPIVNSSGLFTLAFGEGKGGYIDIDANHIFVAAGAQAATVTFGRGEGGYVFAKANQIELVGTSRGDVPSSFSAIVEEGASGKGGNLTIETEFLLITDGAQAAVTTFGDGNAGNLNVKAEEIQLTGTSSSESPSGLFSNVELAAEGEGGQIKINADKLNIFDGAQVSALTLGKGAGGSLAIKTDEIEISGGVTQSPSGFQSTVAPPAEGHGGSLIIDTVSLKVIDGGQIAVSTAGSGTGGELELKADQIELIGRTEFGASGIFGNAIIGNGNGGNLIIDTNSLTILDGATISASNFSSSNQDIESAGAGSAGSVEIQANTVKLDSASADAPSSITASTYNAGGGDINLNIAGDISISNNSGIDADTRGDADGGSINLSADNLNLNSEGQVSVDSNSEESDIEERGSNNTTSSGRAGNIHIRVNNLNAEDGKITATSKESGGGDIYLTTDFILLENSQLSTSVSNGDGGGGNLKIDSNYVIAQDNSEISANAVQGDGGNIDITTQVFLLTTDSLVDASSKFAVDGVVDINSPDIDQQIGISQLPTKVTDPTALITAVCPKDKTNALSSTGKGGLADNPSQNLRGESVWEDLRDFLDLPKVDNLSRSDANQEIIEARAWNINDKGNVELLNYVPTRNKPDYWALFNQCRK